jgi:autotransporter passenger strand-loop-strand repeat protein
MADTTVVSSGVISSGLAAAVDNTVIVLSGGTTLVTTVMLNGSLTVLSGGSAISTTVQQGGTEIIASGGVGTGTVVSGGSELDDGTSVSPTITAGGTLVVGAYGALSGHVTFSGTGGVLEISGGDVAGTISGFAAGDEIDLPSQPYALLDGLAYDSSTGILTVSYGAGDDGAGDSEIDLSLSGGYTTGDFVAYPSIDSGSVISILRDQSTNSGNSLKDVFSGQVSSGVSVGGGASMQVYAGGTAVATVLNGGGAQLDVHSGGSAIGTLVSAAEEDISSGGTTIGDTLTFGATQYVDGTAVSTTGAQGATQYVQGVVSATNLNGTEQIVGSGGTAIGTIVSGRPEDGFYGPIGSIETVSGGGVTSGTFLLSGVEVDGGTAIGTIASAFSDLDIVAGGTAVSAVIDSGSFETISAGGVATGTILNAGGVLSLGGTSASPAVASATIIAGGAMVVGSYGVASAGITFSGSGGVLDISGGTVTATISGFATADEIDLATLPYASSPSATFDSATDVLTVTAGGSSIAFQLSGDYPGQGFVLVADGGSGTIVAGIETITVSAGEISSGLVIGRDQILNVLSGGTVVSATIDAGGSETVFSGAVTTGTMLSGGSETIFGTAISTVVGSGARQTVLSGGVTSATTVTGGGDYVSAGARADATIVSGGSFDVVSGGAASGAVIMSTGSASVAAGGVSINAVVDSGGTETIGSGGYVYDGPLAIASDTMIDGGTVQLYGDGTLADGVSFIGSGGFLVVSSYTVPTTVSGFGATDTIDIAGLVVRNPTSVTLDAATDVLTVSAAGQFPYAIPLAGDYTSAVFGLTVSGQIDGTQLTVESNPAVTNSAPCFARGTRIATERGPIAVEQLAIRDRVMTPDGEARPITWIGSRRVDCRRHPAPHKVQPVLIAAHAFAPGAPSRDLLLSPDHAIFAEAVLIPVKHLVDGITIRQIVLPAITYFHIELDRHSVILAEGLTVETYLDTGDRSAFDSAEGATALHPAFASERGDIALVMDALGYAPLRITGPEVEAVRARLGGRRRYASSVKRCFPLARRAEAAPGSPRRR